MKLTKNQQELKKFIKKYRVTGRVASDITGISPILIYQMKNGYYDMKDEVLAKLKSGYYKHLCKMLSELENDLRNGSIK